LDLLMEASVVSPAAFLMNDAASAASAATPILQRFKELPVVLPRVCTDLFQTLADGLDVGTMILAGENGCGFVFARVR
jgi:hypothetical protein